MRERTACFLATLLLSLGGSLAGACSPSGSEARGVESARSTGSGLAAASAPGAPPPATLPTDRAVPADAPLVVFLGDSLAAGLHLPEEEAFPAVLQAELVAAGVPFRLVNAGISGDTTAGGLARLDWLLSQDPAVVVVELGGNDGLRGVALEAIEQNLRGILVGIREAGARPLLLGMALPTNYGGDYGAGFAAIYPALAEETGAAHVPFFMRGVFGRPELFLPDGLHPTTEGHRIMAHEVQTHLRQILESL